MLIFFLSVIPILWLIVSLGILKMPAHKSCGTALILTAILAVTGLKMPFTDMGTAALEGAVVALWPILIVIGAAIFTYNLSLHTKSMDTIKQMLTQISDDKRIQVLILAWGFGGFLEAVAGYGTAVAIPAGILLALGVEPVLAAVICLVANTAPTAFGAVGIPVLTLANVTNLSDSQLSFFVSLQLFLLIMLIPFVLVWMISGKLRNLKGVIGITFASAISFALPQVFIAKYLGAELPALAGSILSMAVTILLAKRRTQKGNKSEITLKSALKAWSPYILTFTLVILVSPVVPFLNEMFGHIKTQLVIFSGADAQPVTIKWISNAGILMLLSAVIGGKIQGASFKEIFKVFIQTLKQLKNSFITVISIVALAKIMGYSGMINSIADVLVKYTGVFYVLIAPLIGALGTFLTGSDTSANVLFGPLQIHVANALGLDPYWLAAANTSGATAGKMISPQSIAVVTSATGLIGCEGKIFTKALKFCLCYIIILGILVALFR